MPFRLPSCSSWNPPVFAVEDENACVRWANEFVNGTAEGCDELCPQAKQFDDYDYQAGLTAAFESRGSSQAMDQAVSLLDYTALEGFDARFPKTYALAEHE